MRNPHTRAVPSRLLPLALSGLAALAALAACTPNLDDKLSCLNSTQCPTGYYCAADGKCQVGATVPELALITPTAGVIFSGVIQLQISAIDPAGITSVTVALGGADAGAGGSSVMATAGANNVYTASLDTRALGVSSNGSFGIVITGTNANGKSSTLPVTLQIDDQPPAIGALTINPATVAQGQPATINFNVGETLSVQPQVKLTPPDGSSPRYAAYVSISSNLYTYQFIPLSTDPTGAWKVLVTAQDSYGNSASSSGNDTLNVVTAGTNSVTFSGKRGDGITGPDAFYLNSTATLALTATFGAPLGSAPSAYLCPVGTPGPCAVNTTGSQPLTVTASSGSAYVANITPTTGVSNSNEGTHVVTFSGTSTAGVAVSGSVQVVYDFTAPVFAVQQLNGSNNYDHLGRQMVSKTGTGSLLFIAALNESKAAMSSVTANVDGTGPTVPVNPNPTVGGALPQFLLTLDGSLASTPPVADSFAGHYVSVVACDLAANCATQTTQNGNGLGFVEVDKVPAAVSFGCPSNADGGCGTVTSAHYGPTQVFRAGQTVTIDVDLDRELAYDQNDELEVELGGDEESFSFSSPPPAESTGATPFGYTYQTTIYADVPDGVYPVVLGTSSYDGYGNNIFPSPVDGPNITVKTSIPSLYPANSAAGILASSPVTVAPNSTATFYFVSQSNAGNDDDLSQGTVTACFNPQVSGGALSCTNAAGASGLGFTYVSQTRGAVPNNLGVITINATSSATAGEQTLLIEFTDAAGNTGLLPVSVFVNAPPSIASWWIDNTTPAPKQTVNLYVTFADQGTMTSVAGILASGFNQVIPGSTANGTVTQLGPLYYKIPFTLPSKCDGVNGDPAAASFNIGVIATDSAGNNYESNVVGTSPLNPIPAITCVPAAAVTNVSFNKTIVPAGGSATALINVNEPVANIPNAAATGSAETTSGASLTGVAASQNAAPTSTRQFTITYTMPSTCNGANGSPSDGVPFTAYVSIFDGANSTAPISIGTLTCANAPRVLDYNWNTTVVAQGGTATATLTVNEPLTAAGGSSATSYTSGISFSPSVASATANAVSNDPLAYTIAVTFSSCPLNGTGGTPPDATPIPINATLSDGIHALVTTSIGAVTCTTTSIAGATVAPALIQLIKQPFGDGTLRSIVVASPGALTGWTGSGAGVTLTALNGGSVGSGALKGDGSVEAFELSAPYTQLGFVFSDLLGNTKQVQPGKYPEQLNINGTGALIGANQNPFQVYDVSTGDDTFFAAPYWVDGGPGPDGGNATLVLASLPDGGFGTAAGAMSELASIDDQLLSVSSAPVFSIDGGAAGPGHMTYLGTEQFGNPMYVNADGGPAPFVGATPAPRTFAAMAFSPNYNPEPLYLIGGFSNTGTLADPIGTYWAWTRDQGWSKNTVTVFDGGAPAPYNAGIGFDNNYDLLVLGGYDGGSYTSGIAALYSNYLIDGGVSQSWGDGGTLGTPLGDGGIGGTITPYIAASSYGYTSYNVAEYNYNTSANVTVMETNYSGVANCIIYMPGCSGCSAGYAYTPVGNYALYSCANTNGLANAFHLDGALTTAQGQELDGGTFGLFSFGGKYNGSNYASNDFYGAQLSYNGATGALTTNWVTLTPTSGSIPPARQQASLYYIPQTNRIGLFGGVSATNTLLNDSWEYDIASNTWTEVDNQHADAIMVPARANTTSAAYNGNLYVFSGNDAISDGWTLGRETRNRIIAKLPIASQLSSPGSATLGQLNVTVANPNNNVFNVGRAGPRERGAGASPDLTSYDSYSSYDLYLWTGTAWAYVISIGNYVESISIPAAQLPSITSGDGNLYLMVAGAPAEGAGQTGATINLDALQFSLTFQ